MAARKKVTSKKTAPPTVTAEWIDAPEIPVFYINNAELRGSMDELRLDLGEVQDKIPEEQKLQIARRVRLFMSWPYVKRFAAVLNNQIQRHEQRTPGDPELESVVAPAKPN